MAYYFQGNSPDSIARGLTYGPAGRYQPPEPPKPSLKERIGERFEKTKERVKSFFTRKQTDSGGRRRKTRKLKGKVKTTIKNRVS